MSVFSCRDCERQIDTDYHPSYPTEDGYGLRCEACQERKDEITDLNIQISEYRSGGHS